MKYRVINSIDASAIQPDNIDFVTEDYGELCNYCKAKFPSFIGWNAYGLCTFEDGTHYIVFSIIDEKNKALGYFLQDIETDG